MGQEKNSLGNSSREKVIIRTSILGIAANVLLAAFKAAVGVLSHSIAITMDAVNNLSDALSSLITIIGTKLAGKAPDRKHPLGHGRVEYLSAMIIAVIVLYAGVSAFVESVKKILHPELPEYSPATLLIIAVAVIVKILLGTYVKRTGQKVNSDSLIASGSDALFDAIISASTLVAAVILILFGFSLEAWLGAAISAIIIKSGIEILRDAISEILGERVEADLAKAVKSSVVSFPQVQGAYDLFVHNYGPDRLIGSVHIEVPDVMTAEELDVLEREISLKVMKETGVIMTGISVYSVNTKDEETVQMRKQVYQAAMSWPEVLQVHGFYADRRAKEMRFDAVISFDAKDRAQLLHEVQEKIARMYPDYTIHVAMDYDISD